ncbi:hypothetical protein ACLOJK_014589 [Asimina triloba]
METLSWLLLEKMGGDGFRSPAADLLCGGRALTADWRRWALADLVVDLGMKVKMDSLDFAATVKLRILKGCRHPLLLLIVGAGREEEGHAVAGWLEKTMTQSDLQDLWWSKTREKMGGELVIAVIGDGEDDVRSR